MNETFGPRNRVSSRVWTLQAVTCWVFFSLIAFCRACCETLL